MLDVMNPLMCSAVGDVRTTDDMSDRVEEPVPTVATNQRQGFYAAVHFALAPLPWLPGSLVCDRIKPGEPERPYFISYSVLPHRQFQHASSQI